MYKASHDINFLSAETVLFYFTGPSSTCAVKYLFQVCRNLKIVLLISKKITYLLYGLCICSGITVKRQINFS